MDRSSLNDENVETSLIIGGVVIVVIVAILMIAHYYRKRSRMGCKCKCDCPNCMNCPYKHNKHMHRHRDTCGKCGGFRMNPERMDRMMEREQVCMQTKDGIVCWN